MAQKYSNTNAQLIQLIKFHCLNLFMTLGYVRATLRSTVEAFLPFTCYLLHNQLSVNVTKMCLFYHFSLKSTKPMLLSPEFVK